MTVYEKATESEPTSGCCGAKVDQMATLPLCVRCNGLLTPKEFQPFPGRHLPGHNDRCRMQPEPTVKELLELSTLYHELITELVDLWGVELTPSLRARAFQIVTEFAEQLKMKTLASAVLAELKENTNATEI